MIKFKYKSIVILVSVGVSVTGVSNASLFDRGNGMIYDNVLNITWLQDANYAATSGYSTSNNGAMNWNQATAWVSNLNYQGLTGWRLPTITDTGSPGCESFAYSGTDCGWNVDTRYSELAYLYHVNLGNQSVVDPSGQSQWGYSYIANSAFQDTAHGNAPDSFSNLQSNPYWSGTEYAPNTSNAWLFYFSDGTQVNQSKDLNFMYAWAVRPGDVAVVPIPRAVWLFISALSFLSYYRRKTKQHG
jgi:hypothetical protein